VKFRKNLMLLEGYLSNTFTVNACGKWETFALNV